MKNILIILIIISLTSCYSRQYPNGDGTMTVVEYNIFKKDSTVLTNVRCPINHRGTVTSIKKGTHFVGIAGKGGHSVTHYDIEIIWINYKGESKIFEDRISMFEHDSYLERGYPVIQERFYPYYEIRPIY